MSVAQRGSEEVGDSGTGRPEGVDLIRRLVSAQRRLLEERASETLISHIQSLSGLEGFLKSPSFDDLNSAAAYGPVIIINQSRFRSYIIIILLKDSHPSIIFTLSDIHDCADHLKDELLRAQKEKGLDSEDYDLTLNLCPRTSIRAHRETSRREAPPVKGSEEMSGLVLSSNPANLPGSPPKAPDKSSLLLVGQHETLPGAWGEVREPGAELVPDGLRPML